MKYLVICMETKIRKVLYLPSVKSMRMRVGDESAAFVGDCKDGSAHTAGIDGASLREGERTGVCIFQT